MANAFAEGAKTVPGVDVTIQRMVFSERVLKPEKLSDFDAILVGSPTYHHRLSDDLERFFEEAATVNLNLKGKIGAAFGSFGWSGEAPRMIIEIMKNKFEMLVDDPPILVSYSPNPSALEKCRELGRRIAEKTTRPAGASVI